MKLYNEELSIGLELIYDGDNKEWINRKGKVCDRMCKGKYVISDISTDYIYIKSLRKNAVKEHSIHRTDIENKIFELELDDLTTHIALNFILNKEWYVYNKELLDNAVKHNKK